MKQPSCGVPPEGPLPRTMSSMVGDIAADGDGFCQPERDEWMGDAVLSGSGRRILEQLFGPDDLRKQRKLQGMSKTRSSTSHQLKRQQDQRDKTIRNLMGSFLAFFAFFHQTFIIFYQLCDRY